jgi:hypothetical protein
VAAGVDVEVFAAGFRNTFDLTLTPAGLLYAMDNGPNLGFGPASTGPGTQSAGDVETADSLDLLAYGNYYGHPNRNRGRYDVRQNVWHGLSEPSDLGIFTQMLDEFPASTNGILSYTANTFGGAMRGDLILQQWNTSTYRATLDPTGGFVLSQEPLPVALNSLDIIQGPGGAILGVDYGGGKVVVAKPVEPQPAAGIGVYDILPWRASAAGGASFVIGGAGFGTVADTSVTIGGIDCAIVSVTPTCIRGTIPANASPTTELLDVSVASAGAIQTLTGAFRYLTPPGTDDSGASAYVSIDPGGTISDSSTYDANSFQVTNTSTGGQKIARVRLDLRTAVLMDLVFDPNGVAGDTVGKPLTIDTNTGVGTITYAMTNAHQLGYNVVDFVFTDFGPGEAVGFSADLDPTSIQGVAAPGPNGSGSVSGLELAGAEVVVYFDDGSSRVANTYRKDGSSTGSEAVARGNVPAAPDIEVLGITAQKAATSAAAHTVRVYGTPGLTASLVRIEAGLYLAGVPGGGYDIDPFEANSAVGVSEQTAVVGGAGYVDFAVALTQSDPNAGFNHFAAVLINSEGIAGRTSPVHVLEYNP